MAQNVLVPVDGSRCSMAALSEAADYARIRGARVIIVTIVPSVADIDLELSVAERDRLLESLKCRGEELLRRSQDHYDRMVAGGPLTTLLGTASSVASEIITIAEKERIDIIFMGSRGRNANGRFSLGSTTANVVRHSPCSVYVVKEPA